MPRKAAPENVLHQPSYLREWRKFRDLSQEELAARAGVKHSTVSRLENGITGWVQDTMEALADALDCSVSELLFMDPTHPEDFFREIVGSRPGVARTGFANFLSEKLGTYKPD
jgi:transcriptional regulator with XRE-family HTH domain